MINAEEARELAKDGFDVEVRKQLESVYEQIRFAAENKKRAVVLYSGFWARGGYHLTDAYKAAVSQLEALGFDVEFFYDERQQFVKMYTVVKW